jgi:hypothetical protein
LRVHENALMLANNIAIACSNLILKIYKYHNNIMIIINFVVPDAPRVKVSPVYSNDIGKLSKLLAEINHQPVS